DNRRPLVILAPKSLLRSAAAASSLNDLAAGSFQPVIHHEDPQADKVARLVLASGKMAIELDAARGERDGNSSGVVLARVELLYPFPREELSALVSGYPNLRHVVWAQEEPENMGAWSYIAPRLRQVLPENVPLCYVGRPRRASPAEGSPIVHGEEQNRIIQCALEGEHG
ncbi:MAG: 2-oxoglutarate dehydrogenase E1 component, partial [Chloroflexota bacterium]